MDEIREESDDYDTDDPLIENQHQFRSNSIATTSLAKQKKQIDGKLNPFRINRRKIDNISE